VQPSNTNTPIGTSAPESAPDFADLLDRLKSESLRNQLQVVRQLSESGEAGLNTLMAFLLERKAHLNNGSVGVTDGAVYQALFAANQPKTQEFLQTHFPQGVVPLKSDRGIDYAPLQALLAQQDFQAADRLTLEKLCELAGTQSIERKWIYFTEIDRFPVADLQTINTLWLVHSEGRFGYSVQRELWLGVGKDWDKLWPKIGWKSGNNWTRYPQEFIWSLDAPRGHLPLSNQLRGVRVINALLSHPAWKS
jgi:hypothetical protein